MIKRTGILLLMFFTLLASGCEDVDLRQATEAGRDAIKAVTLSEGEVHRLSRKAAARLDAEHRIAPPGSRPAARLKRLVAKHRQEDGESFSFRVYLSPRVNAFALGDGSIRVYRGLMERMTDQELLFVIGHEIGHVVQDHVRRKMAVALAGSALRKGIASQENIVGELAGSALGGFVEQLANAQFSQEEEEAADDYALHFMEREGYDPRKAVSALEKLARGSGEHSFLSSHPAPGERAKRLQAQLADEDRDTGDTGLLDRVLGLLANILDWLADIFSKLADWLSGMASSGDPRSAE